VKLLLLALALTAAAPTWAQPIHAGGATATRSASRYLALERELQQAVAARDDASLRTRLALDFTYRSPANPEVLDREAWLKRESRRPLPVRDLTVREQDDIAVVSFLAGKRFVVDMWKGDTLLARSATTSLEATRTPSRPSGRE
jgi:hypothetical protein